jgi:16S rRNA (guanine527-N7)-methyltransferase
MDRNMNIFKKGLEELNIELNNIQFNQFMDYYEILIEKNKVMNLTSITEFNEVIVKHFIDSLTCVKALDIEIINSVIDVGTGAGFPGIPLKIAFPHLKIVLLDSLNKRINFLNEVIENLELNNISTIHGRAEDIARNDDYRERYDLCVSRAVANFSTLSEYGIPFVKENGIFLSYKSQYIEEELSSSREALNILGGRLLRAEQFVLPTTDIERILLVVKKIKKTPQKYPRKAGVPEKNPINI